MDADQAAWLLERVRAGLLTDDRLALAAYAEHPAARLALEGQLPTRTGLTAWIRGLRYLDGEGLRDAAVRLSALVVLCRQARDLGKRVEVSEELFEGLRRMWEFPTPALRQLVGETIEGLTRELYEEHAAVFDMVMSGIDPKWRDATRGVCVSLLAIVVHDEQRSTLAFRLASALRGLPDMERAQAHVKETVARWALGGPAFPSSG